MITHSELWGAIDALAARHGLTPSGLARRAGLDPTTFNRSKRIASDSERPRWPSTESLVKALDAVGADLGDISRMARGSGEEIGRGVPLIGLAQAGADGYFDDAGFPVGSGWDEVNVPGLTGEGAYALEIAGDSMAPVFRDGDRIVVSPGSPVRRGDRIVVRLSNGEVLAKELGRVTARTVELISLNPDYAPRTLELSDVSWMARIVWASQ
jgi:phage repressor protein C with HTH and peptisase S24 domain